MPVFQPNLSFFSPTCSFISQPSLTLSLAYFSAQLHIYSPMHISQPEPDFSAQLGHFSYIHSHNHIYQPKGDFYSQYKIVDKVFRAVGPKDLVDDFIPHIKITYLEKLLTQLSHVHLRGFQPLCTIRLFQAKIHPKSKINIYIS